MKKYFPYLRGKQNELIALRTLADDIAQSSKIIPIIELVNGNSTTMISLDRYVEAEMPFVYVTNPSCGDYAGNEDALYGTMYVNGPLAEYDNFIPALIVDHSTSITDAEKFVSNYESEILALIYKSIPNSSELRAWCLQNGRTYYHIVNNGRVPIDFLNGLPQIRRVLITDNFNRQTRNADYPDREHFADLEHATHWGDFSIQGDYFAEGGGAAYTVAVHHININESNRSLDIHHYLSDHQESPADTSRKIIEAVSKLVDDFDAMNPNDTLACGEYREMAESEESRGLGYLKRLAIQHHLEIMLRI